VFVLVGVGNENIYKYIGADQQVLMVLLVVMEHQELVSGLAEVEHQELVVQVGLVEHQEWFWSVSVQVGVVVVVQEHQELMVQVVRQSKWIQA
jgi:hypothetical protein